MPRWLWLMAGLVWERGDQSMRQMTSGLIAAPKGPFSGLWGEVRRGSHIGAPLPSAPQCFQPRQAEGPGLGVDDLVRPFLSGVGMAPWSFLPGCA